jgi:hypothetical protein
MLTQAYSEEVAQTLGRWVRVERVEHGLHIHNRQMDLTDHGDRITAGLGGNDKEIATMLQLARAKGWTQLEFTGDDAFRERAAAAALKAGFDLADADLKSRILDAQRKAEEVQKEAEEARWSQILTSARILAEWIRQHPRQAQAQRLAGGKLPFACPDGLDAADLQQPELWTAADAWTVGRYGDKTKWHELSNGSDPVQAKAAQAGREERLNESARRGGITLRVGSDAPTPDKGMSFTKTGTITRENIEGWARDIQARQASAGISASIVVAFGSKSTADDRVMVLEHLLRQGVALDDAALKQAGHGDDLKEAQERLKTHEPDGNPQEWYTQHLEEQRQKRQEEERAEVERLRIEAEKRARYLDDFCRLARDAGYQDAFDPYHEVIGLDDHQSIQRDIDADPTLRDIAEQAYQEGRKLGALHLAESTERKAAALAAAREQRQQQQYYYSSQDRNRLDDEW